jgi:hypothetical protein
VRVNRVRYWDLAEIEQVERERMAKALKVAEIAA